MRDYRQRPSSHVFLSSPRLTFLACRWFSHALAFRSLYYPWRKTTTSSPRRFSLGKRGILVVYNFYSSTGSCCSENSGSAGRGGGATPVIRVEVCSVLSGTHAIYIKLKQQHTRFPWVGGREHSIVWLRWVCATAQHNVVWRLFQTLDLREYPPPRVWTYELNGTLLRTVNKDHFNKPLLQLIYLQ